VTNTEKQLSPTVSCYSGEPHQCYLGITNSSGELQSTPSTTQGLKLISMQGGGLHIPRLPCLQFFSQWAKHENVNYHGFATYFLQHTWVAVYDMGFLQDLWYWSSGV